MDDNELGERILGCALIVHRALGPGLLESVYETCPRTNSARHRWNIVGSWRCRSSTMVLSLMRVIELTSW